MLNYKTKREFIGDTQTGSYEKVTAIAVRDNDGKKYSFDTYPEAEYCIENLLTTFPTDVFQIQKVYTK